MNEGEFNPYETPVSPGTALDLAAFGELVFGWEKLRILYNALMILPGIAVLFLWTTRTDMPWAAALTFGLLIGAAANIAFFLGPLAELYLRAVFRQGENIGKGRWLIFSGGMVVSAGVVLLSALTSRHFIFPYRESPRTLHRR